MIYVKEKTDCCGCTACINICPVQAIQMKEDEEGFLYPEADIRKCINCGACDKVCPIRNNTFDYTRTKLKGVYAVKSNNDLIRRRASSGGVGAELVKYLCNDGNIVWGAVFDDEFKVIHDKGNTVEAIERFSTSKYVQSDLRNSFAVIKDELERENKVCFTGTPCQVEALLKYLGREYNNLITIDVICHGVPSPRIWSDYLKEICKKHHSNINSVNFRSKEYGYKSSLLKISFENGKVYFGSMRNDPYIKCFFSNVTLRPSCYNCRFKSQIHKSDLTLFDCKSFLKLTGKKDDDWGYTNVFVNSAKGEELLDGINEFITKFEVNIDDVIRFDGSMVLKSARPHPARGAFFDLLDKSNIYDAVQILMPISFWDRTVVKTRGLLYSMGILNMLRELCGKK